MWYSNEMFHYMSKAEFVTLVSLKVPSGSFEITKRHPIKIELPLCYLKLKVWEPLWQQIRSLYLLLQSGAGVGVPDVVGHLVAVEALQVLVLDAVGVLALHRLPGVLVEPGSAQDVERLAWNVG